MKKFFSNNYMNKRKVLEFLDSKGFYIVLVLCVCIVSVTAYVVTKRNLESYVDNSNIAGTTKIANPNSKTEVDKQPSSVAVKKSTNEGVIANKNTKPSNSDVTKLTTKNTLEQKTIQKLEMPVMGNITKDYAKTSLVYSKTLEQWTTHEGIDISSDRGTPVKSSCDGIVEEIYSDYKYGTTIIINSNQGIKVKYSNLSTDSMVKKGQKIKTGDVISGVGNTSVFESGEQPHMHFEVIENGSNINPKNYLK